MTGKKILIVFPFSFLNRTQYIIEKFFHDSVDFSSVLHLTSRWARIDDFRTRLILTKARAVIPPVSYSLKSFAGKIVQDYSNYRVISGIEQFLILLNLSIPISEKININPVSFASKIRSFIKDFKVGCEKIDFDLWLKEINSYPWKYEENKSIVEKAFTIMMQYQEYLEKNNLVDEDDLYRVATQAIEGMKFQNVLIEGMLEFIPSEKPFIKKIAQQSELFIIAYQYDKNATCDVKNLILEPNFSFLQSITDSVEIVESANVDREPVVYNFPSPDEEIKGIAQKILEKMAENSQLNWEDFLVVFPDMLSYRALVERIFSRFKIPFCMTPGYVLSQDPSIVAIMSFLRWIDAPNWENLMSIFTSPFFSFDKDETVKFSAESRKIFKGIGFFPDETWLGKWNNWKKINHARKMMDVQHDSISGWVERLKKAIEKISWQCFDTEGKTSFTDLLEQLDSDIVVSREEFVRIMKTVMDFTEIEKSKGYGVRVMGVLDSVGLETKFVFFGGATEDCLPMATRMEEFFLPEPLKEVLSLNTYQLRIARERLDIYRLKMSGENIVFTYPAKVGGRQKNKSIMLYGMKEVPYKTNFYISKPVPIFSLRVDYDKFRRKFIKEGKVHFTTSQLDQLARCPYDFYLRYVEEVEPYQAPEIEEMPEFWGTLLHKAAEKAAEEFKGKIMDEQSMETQVKRFCEYVNEFLDNPEKVSSEYHFRIPPVMRSFLEKRKNSVFESFRKIIQNHKQHQIVELEKKHSVELEKMVITGRFDRIELTENDIYEIIDFKSGKTPNLKKKYPESGDCLELENLELPLYALMYYKMKDQVAKVFVWSLNFEYLTGDEKEYSQITVDFLNKFEQSLNNLGKKLIDGDFKFEANTKNCYGCVFSNYCIAKNEVEDE